jgi:hypothetical protein
MVGVDDWGLDSPFPSGASDPIYHKESGQWSAYVNGQLEFGADTGSAQPASFVCTSEIAAG